MSRIAHGELWGAVAAGVTAVATGLVVVAAAPGFADGGAESEDRAPSSGMLDESEFVGLSLTGGGESPPPGEEAEFQAMVANGDGAPVEGALLAQHVPDTLEIVEVGGEGVVEEGIVNWRVDVPHGEEAVFTLRVRVVEEAAAGDRLMSTACLLLERGADPAACASDTLVVAESTMMSRVAAMVDREGLLRAVGVALVVAVAWLLWRRRVAALRR